MDINIKRRAEIALRSLKRNEQRQILKALAQIESVEPKDLFKVPNLRKLRKQLGENLYSYRGNDRLRLVLSIQENVCTVEDIVSHDKLNRLVSNLGQQ